MPELSLQEKGGVLTLTPIEHARPIMSWQPEVQTDNSGKWYTNALRFATKEEAEANALDLMGRWMLVTDCRAAESTDPVNYRWVNGQLESLDGH